MCFLFCFRHGWFDVRTKGKHNKIQYGLLSAFHPLVIGIPCKDRLNGTSGKCTDQFLSLIGFRTFFVRTCLSLLKTFDAVSMW